MGFMIIVTLYWAADKPIGKVLNWYMVFFYLILGKQWCLMAIGMWQYADSMSSETVQ